MAKSTVESRDQLDPFSLYETRFWEKVERGNGEECWKWKGYIDPQGRGRMTVVLKPNRLAVPLTASRMSYIIHHGDISPGLQILHSCDNPGCCNPDHLWEGTISDNVQDMHSKGRWNYTHSAEARAKISEARKGKGHPQSEDSIEKIREKASQRSRDYHGRFMKGE